MSVFENIEMAPTDPIFGLTEEFKKDSNPEKMNLGAGVYKDAEGQTPVLSSVKKAEARLLEKETNKSYLPIEGLSAFNSAVQQLLFGEDHEIVTTGRAATAQTPGGTGALRAAADFIHRNLPGAKIWVSDPTWVNHQKIFAAAGLEIKTYPYFDAATNNLDFAGMLSTLERIPAGDVVLLHGCCHNPSGVDPDNGQWESIAGVVADRGLLPLLDFAYQGFGEGLREDAGGLLALCRLDVELFVASSYSKNFSLYGERVGALTVVSENGEASARALSQIKLSIRASYSNPPTHGAAIVSTILGDPDLRREWQDEVRTMRDRINDMRRLFVETLADKKAGRDFSFIARQRGMFSFSGLSSDQVEVLREKHAIYVVRSGRINVAGMTESTMDRLCEAIASVL